MSFIVKIDNKEYKTNSVVKLVSLSKKQDISKKRVYMFN